MRQMEKLRPGTGSESHVEVGCQSVHPECRTTAALPSPSSPAPWSPASSLIPWPHSTWDHLLEGEHWQREGRHFALGLGLPAGPRRQKATCWAARSSGRTQGCTLNWDRSVAATKSVSSGLTQTRTCTRTQPPFLDLGHPYEDASNTAFIEPFLENSQCAEYSSVSPRSANIRGGHSSPEINRLAGKRCVCKSCPSTTGGAVQ